MKIGYEVRIAGRLWTTVCYRPMAEAIKARCERETNEPVTIHEVEVDE